MLDCFCHFVHCNGVSSNSDFIKTIVIMDKCEVIQPAAEAKLSACRFSVRTGGNGGGLMPRARDLGDREHCLAADRLGGEAGRFHVDFSRGETLELRPEPSLAP